MGASFGDCEKLLPTQHLDPQTERQVNEMKKRIACFVALLAVAVCLSCRPKARPTVGTVRPEPGDIADFHADPVPARTHFKTFKVERKDLEDVLRTWHQVSEDHWRHGYHHLAGEDRTGTISLKDGTSIKWMVKPGGLAALTFKGGAILYLARELTPWKEDGASVDAR